MGFDPRITTGTTMIWVPLLNVSIITQDPKRRRVKDVVDSGAATSIFHAAIGEAIGMDVERGIEGALGGVIGGLRRKVYYHDVKIELLGQMIAVRAGFSADLSVAAILGRSGFFDNFTITFDPCNNPPGLVLERFYRS